MQHIGILPKGFLGDIILTSPVIEALRESYPDSRITVIAPPAASQLLQADPLISQVISFDRRESHAGLPGLCAFSATMKNQRFDALYSFQRSPRSALLARSAGIPHRVGYSDAYLGCFYNRLVTRTGRYHEVLRNLELVYEDLVPGVQAKVRALCEESSVVGKGDVGSFGKLRVPDVSSEALSPRVREIVGAARPYVVLSPSSAWETKRWYAEGFHQVAQEILRGGERVVVVGSPSDAAVCEVVAADIPVTNLCGETSVFDLIGLIAHAAAVVCNDSFALHVASATQAPSVVIFCATSPSFGFGPWRAPSIVLEKEGLFCKPCRRHGSRRCPQGTEACMQGVSASQVMQALDGVRKRDLRLG